MLDKAGIDPKSLWNLDWNPKDGGSFGQTIAKLTVDANGKTALDAGFDPKNVVQYGLLINGLSDGFGHEEWANFRRFTRVEVLRRSMVDAVLIYDDPKLIETVQWVRRQQFKKRCDSAGKRCPSSGSYGTLCGAKRGSCLDRFVAYPLVQGKLQV
jgi:hypothetical protein